MSYVGADAQRLGDLRAAVRTGADEVALRRRRVAALFAEAAEVDVVGPGLSTIESGLSSAACEVGAAANVAAADAAAGGQDGWRARLGLVDDALLDVLWVNDLSRVFTGRDINTGTQVGIGGRLASGVFLIPFTKLAKGTKLLKLGDGAVEIGAQAAGRAASLAVKNADEVRATLLALKQGTSKSGKVRVVASETKLNELFDELARGGTPLGDLPWPSRALPDGTIIRLRPNSRSTGSATIDISFPGQKADWKVHISQ